MPQAEVSGAGDDAANVDVPSAYVTVRSKGESIGTYLLTCNLEQAQTVHWRELASFDLEDA